MGILIEGMEMPDTCTRCDYIGLNVAIGCKVVTGTNGRADNCPLTEVPEPHGRLIDADALMLKIREYTEEYGDMDENGWHSDKWCAMQEAKMAIADAPTVIPASEEDE